MKLYDIFNWLSMIRCRNLTNMSLKTICSKKIKRQLKAAIQKSDALAMKVNLAPCHEGGILDCN